MKRVVIVGAGHNGLITAGYLARAGLDVTVLEARAVVGGATVTEEVLPGFRSSLASFVVGLLRPEIISDLQLEEHGLELYMAEKAISCTIFDDGTNFTMWSELDRTLAEVKKKFGQSDLEGFMELGLDMQALGDILQPMLLAQPRPLSEVARTFESLGQQVLFERFISGSILDCISSYFQSEKLKSHFAFPSVVSMYGGPSTPGTAYLLAHHSVGEFQGRFGQWGYARGGTGAISEALANSLIAAGGQIRTGAVVKRIVSRGGVVRAVELVGGEQIPADIIVSNADPKRTLLGLVGAQNLPKAFVRNIEGHDNRGSMARVYVAVDELPAFVGFDSTQPGPEHEGHLFLGPSVDAFENGWDAQRRGRIPDELPLEMLIDSVREPEMVPPGKHLLTLGIQQLPFDLKGTDWDTEKHAFSMRVVDSLLKYAPNLDGKILGVACRTPLDWERDLRLTGGNIYHGAMSISRLFGGRPGGLRGGYAAPIEGLYLCGSGTHPGGGVMGASGFNAAMTVLTDLGLETPRPFQTTDAPLDATGAADSAVSRAFKNPLLRKVMSTFASSSVSRPLGRALTRSKKG